MRRTFVGLAAVAALAMAGCGGDDSGEAEAEIAQTLKTGFTTKDVKEKCEDVVTASFIKEVYGSVEACRRAEKSEEDDNPPTGVDVTSTKIDGDKATAEVKLQGGDTEGATGTVELRKEGERWAVDGLGIDLLRSQLEVGLKGSAAEQVPQLRDAEVRNCFTEELGKLSDEEFRRLAYDSIAEKDTADDQFGKALVGCLGEEGTGSGGSSQSFLRQKFEEGIAESARKDGVPQKTIDCINKQLRDLISDKEIADTATSGSGEATPEIKEKVAKAITACGGTGATTESS